MIKCSMHALLHSGCSSCQQVFLCSAGRSRSRRPGVHLITCGSTGVQDPAGQSGRRRTCAAVAFVSALLVLQPAPPCTAEGLRIGDSSPGSVPEDLRSTGGQRASHERKSRSTRLARSAHGMQNGSAPTARRCTATGTSFSKLHPVDVQLRIMLCVDKRGPSLGQLLRGPKTEEITRCTRKCLPACIRGGEGAPGLGPLTVRKDLVKFKDGFRTRAYCLSECTQVCAASITGVPAAPVSRE